MQNAETEGSWCTIKSVRYNGYLPENWIPNSCNNTDPIEVSPNCNNVPGYESEGLSQSHSGSSQLSPASAALDYVLFSVLFFCVFLYNVK